MDQVLWFQAARLPDGWASQVQLTLAEGRIAAVERDVAPSPRAARGDVALPGLCNVHSHTFQRAMAGLAETRGPGDDDFWTWRAWMYRFLDRLAPEDIGAIAAQAFVEMLESGFTRCGEFHYLHHAPDGTAYANLAETAERICEAAAESGIALTLLPTYYAQGGFGGAAANPGQRRFLNNVDGFGRLVEASAAAVALLPDGVLGLAPHSLRAVTPEDLARVVRLRAEGPIHIHAAEQVKEVEDCLAWSGRRPVEWLLDHAPVDARWCVIHATHMTPDECRRLAAAGATVGLCPVTEANLGDGVFPAVDYLGAGGRFGVGTDSNICIDASGELRALEYSQRLTRRSRNALGDVGRPSTGAALFERAHAGGAQALGVDGVLAPGAPADIVELDRRRPALAARSGDAVLDAWIFASRSDAVKRVWRHGRLVVDEGRHLERERIASRYQGVLHRLLV